MFLFCSLSLSFQIFLLQITVYHYYKIYKLSKILVKDAISPQLSKPEKRHLIFPQIPWSTHTHTHTHTHFLGKTKPHTLFWWKALYSKNSTNTWQQRTAYQKYRSLHSIKTKTSCTIQSRYSWLPFTDTKWKRFTGHYNGNKCTFDWVNKQQQHVLSYLLPKSEILTTITSWNVWDAARYRYRRCNRHAWLTVWLVAYFKFQNC